MELLHTSSSDFLLTSSVVYLEPSQKNLQCFNIVVTGCFVLMIGDAVSFSNVKPICELNWNVYVGQPWHSGRTQDCRSTGQAINPAPGAWFILKFLSLVQVVSGPVQPYSAEFWPKTLFIHSLKPYVTFVFQVQHLCDGAFLSVSACIHVIKVRYCCSS